MPGMASPFKTQWSFKLRSSADALWPFVADTNRLNRDAGIPVIEEAGYQKKEGGPSRRVLQTRLLGKTFRYEEDPFEWVPGEKMSVKRYMPGTPVPEITLTCRLSPLTEGGTEVTWETEGFVQPAFLKPLVLFILKNMVMPRFEKIFRGYDQSLAAKKPAPRNFSVSIETLPAAIRAFADASPENRRLTDWVLSADTLELTRIRPYVQADQWRIPRRALLESFLQAAQAGLLDFQWEVICPHCRGPEKKESSLESLSAESYCVGCEKSFAVDFENLIELTFRPNPRIRETTRTFFCTGGPKVMPHVISQFTLKPRETREVSLALTEGRYLASAPQTQNEKILLAGTEGRPRIEVTLKPTELQISDTHVSSKVLLKVRNDSETEKFFILKDLAWGSKTVSGRDVLMMQVFQELFATQRLRPGERISVGNLAVVFTDLKASTKLYQEIGDAAAFGAVISHFDIVKKAILERNGTIVKTIGDAVMAVFPNPAPAVQAVREAQRRLLSPPAGMRPLHLKAGIHYGPMLAVTLNENLDYFGSAVNIAARLVTFSSGEDIILSSSTAEDPAAQALFSDQKFRKEVFQTTIKGFGDETFSLCRIS
jgi:class 3 adenylate cyclase